MSSALAAPLLATFLVILSGVGGLRGEPPPSPPLVVTVRPGAPSAKIDPRIFGQFLERTRTPGAGAESAAIRHRAFSPELVTMLGAMKIPVIRFPGGTTVDEADWTDMIDGAPGRAGGRPVTKFADGKSTTNTFGYTEYFTVRDQLKCETILVVNVLDAFAKKRPLEEAALHAAGLLAYVQAPVGATLPKGMPNWPEVRKANGHPEPYHVEYIQLGNEWFVEAFKKAVADGTGLKKPEEIAQWYIKCLHAYIERIREVDPKIPIIIDGVMGVGTTKPVLEDPFIRANVTYVTYHTYGPGAVDKLTRADKPVDPASLAPGDWWHLLVAMPGEFSEAGDNVALGSRYDVARALGYRIACTEWNWNGFGYDRLTSPMGINRALPSALGAAGFLQGLMRAAGTVDLATQSNLVGGWNIAAVKGDHDVEKPALVYSPTARPVNLYNQQHGSQLLETSVTGNTFFDVDLNTGWNQAPKHPVAEVDIIATSSPGMLYLHVINRRLNETATLQLDVSAIGSMKGVGAHHVITGPTDPAADKAPGYQIEETSTPLNVSGGKAEIVVPARSVNVLCLPLAP